MRRSVLACFASVILTSCGTSSGISPNSAVGPALPAAQIVASEPDSMQRSAVALSSSGSLTHEYMYVANSSTNAITIYGRMANGNVAPKRTIGGGNTKMTCVRQIAVDAEGFVYVANLSSVPVDGEICNYYGTGAILVFAPGAHGNAAPVRIIHGPSSGIQNPSAVAVADDGTLYVGNTDAGDAQVPYTHSAFLSFAPQAKGDAVPTSSQTLLGAAAVEDIALAQSSLIVSVNATYNSPGASLYLALPLGSAPEAYGVGGADLGSLAYDASTNTFLAHGDGLTHDVVRLAYGTTGRFASPSSLSTISPAIVASLSVACAPALAVGPEHEFYVGTCENAIEAYRQGDSGTVAPLRTISGPNTQLAGPTSIAIGPSP